MPSEPSSIARARHAVNRTCAAWGLVDVRSAELVVSELVANAVLHGWGHVVLRLFDTGDGLRIEVEDSNPAPPVPTDGHSGRVGGYGMQIAPALSKTGAALVDGRGIDPDLAARGLKEEDLSPTREGMSVLSGH